jgi:arabinan endo-1,5-alpha-L-arabinosidase
MFRKRQTSLQSEPIVIEKSLLNLFFAFNSMQMSLPQRRLLAVLAMLATFLFVGFVIATIPGNRFVSLIHDPSSIVRCKDEYWAYATGIGLKSLRSKDLVSWEFGPRVFERPPMWAPSVVRGNRGYFWAPDIIQGNHRYLLYYSVSGWGKNISAIGLAGNTTLDPADPAFRWSDEGIVIRSNSTDDFNAIDPSILLDAQGKLWMAFGSFWSGIKLVELNPASGKRIKPDSALYSLAQHSEIEAPCLATRDGKYFLFVNWGLCCRGVRSTYEIRVGRSSNITGPYLDRDGKDLMAGGGTLFLGSEGRYVGPGHLALFRDGQNEWISYHFYDREREGMALMAVRRLVWNADGWPAPREFKTDGAHPSPLPSQFAPFSSGSSTVK